MDAFVGVLIGGLISLATTLAVDVARARRELKHRWDATGLAAIEHFVEIANRTIGALYDEGRARSTLGAESGSVAEFDRVARTHMDSFRVAHARTRLTMPALADQLNAYAAALRDLKTFADSGFPDGDERWQQLQANLQDALDRLIAGAASKLQLGAV